MITTNPTYNWNTLPVPVNLATETLSSTMAKNIMQVTQRLFERDYMITYLFTGTGLASTSIGLYGYSFTQKERNNDVLFTPMVLAGVLFLALAYLNHSYVKPQWEIYRLEYLPQLQKIANS